MPANMPENMPEKPKRRLPVRSLSIAAAITLLVGGSVGLLAAQTPRTDHVAGIAPSAPPSSTPTPAPTAEPAPEATDEDLTEKTVDIVLADYFEAMDALKPDTEVGTVSSLVTGDALAEVEAQVIEFESRDWSLEGETRYEDVKVLEADLEAKTPTATVSVCVDSSDVTLVSSDGSPVVADAAETRRAINIYSLAYTDGAWRVTSHSFPDDPQC